MSYEDHTREDLFADPDEIVAFAQAHYATEFPNSARRGCPPAAFLREAALADTLPDSALRSHLFNCSECFRSFRSARISRSPQTIAQQTPRRAARVAFAAPFTNAPALLRATAVGLLLLAVTAGVLVRRGRPETPDVASDNRTPESVEAIAGTATPPAAAAASATQQPRSSATEADGLRTPRHARAQPARRVARAARTTTDVQVVRINLQEENLLRDGDEVGGKPRLINLAPRRQRVRLLLPEGSAGGRYAVSVVDAFGKPLVTTSARSDGRMLTVDLDLRSLAAKRYRLCVTRGAEAPDCYVVSVGDQTGRAAK